MDAQSAAGRYLAPVPAAGVYRVRYRGVAGAPVRSRRDSARAPVLHAGAMARVADRAGLLGALALGESTGYSATKTRARVSATHTGLSPPSRSKASSVVIWAPPGTSSSALSLAWTRMRRAHRQRRGEADSNHELYE